jgi:hypothetical protein
MEGLLCAVVLKSANGRQKHHTQAGLHVCCELALALKSAGTRNTHGGAGAGNRPRDKEVALRGIAGRGEALYGTKAVIWLRGLALCRQIAKC